MSVSVHFEIIRQGFNRCFNDPSLGGSFRYALKLNSESSFSIDNSVPNSITGGRIATWYAVSFCNELCKNIASVKTSPRAPKLQLDLRGTGVNDCGPNLELNFCNASVSLIKSSMSETETSLCSRCFPSDTYLSFLKSPRLILIAWRECSMATLAAAISFASYAIKCLLWSTSKCENSISH